MAKPIVVRFQGKESRFDHKKVSRRKLYGYRRRQAMDASGATCTKASLTEDGRFLLESGMTAQGYFTADRRWVPNKELVGLDPEGGVVEKVPSTLGTAQPLEAVRPQDLLDLRMSSVYALAEQSVDAELKTALEQGTVFRFAFNYRGDYEAETAFLVANDSGTFAVIGDVTSPEWIEPVAVQAVMSEEEEDPFEDDLDFEMF